MSKITFRADDDLVERLEALDASKSEAMREALRAYLDGAERSTADVSVEADAPDDADASDEVGDALVDTIDALVADRLERATQERSVQKRTSSAPQDINLNVSIDGVRADPTTEVTEDSPTPESERKTRDPTGGNAAEPTERRCGQCGDAMGGDHVYCPNCGEKASHRVFCECGDELRSDWSFCPSCGRRTPAADVLDTT